MLQALSATSRVLSQSLVAADETVAQRAPNLEKAEEVLKQQVLVFWNTIVNWKVLPEDKVTSIVEQLASLDDIEVTCPRMKRRREMHSDVD